MKIPYDFYKKRVWTTTRRIGDNLCINRGELSENMKKICNIWLENDEDCDNIFNLKAAGMPGRECAYASV